ncbi:MAG: LacI family DNA-binding transcriptional regulator [Propioniciclava sp.]
MATIYDVAARAGVSPATVSRVFNGIRVTPALAESVRHAATELGFVPNRNARRLRTNSSEIIAMMVPDSETPFFTAMTRAVEDIARADGYSVMLCNTDEDPEREQEYLRVAVSDPVAGVIMVPSSSTTSLELPLARGVPVVCVDRRAPHYPVDAVVADNVGASEAATRRLFTLGHRRVACISGPLGIETADDRALGWSRAVRAQLGQDPHRSLLARAPYTIAGGESATRTLLDLPAPPDAIFAANNRLAAGAARVLAERDQLPPAVGLMSFGGLPLVLLSPLGVQVAHLPARDLGLQAATMMLQRIRGLDTPAREVVLPVILGDTDASPSAPAAAIPGPGTDPARAASPARAPTLSTGGQP